jgi:hypothetical protein
LNGDPVAIPLMRRHFFGVMAGLVPAIHALLAEGPQENMDARDKARA